MQTIEKHIDPLTQEDVLALLNVDAAPRVSIYLPTEREWNKSKRNPTRLKNMLSQAERQLAKNGLKETDVVSLLEPARDLLNASEHYWQHQSDGLALFAAPDTFEAYRLPIDFAERVIVGGPFHIRPLLSFLTDGRFYLLTLTQDGVHLYRATRHAIEEVPLPEDVATSLPEVMQTFDFEAQTSFHTGASPGQGGRRSAMFYGQSDAGDKAQIKKRIDQFVRQLDNGVRDVLAGDSSATPLVLSGLGVLRGFYREANRYPHLLDEGVNGNPDDWSTAELHERAWDVVGPRFDEDREQAVEAYYQLSASDPDRAPLAVDDVVPAAYFERVDTLFVPEHTHAWGTFDPQENRVVLDDAPTASNADLLDVATARTLLNGGTVYTMAPTEMPDHAPVAAVLRY